MSIKALLLLILLFAISFPGCKPDPVLDWSVSEDRVTVFGVLNDCDCEYADIEMLVTDENTGEDHISTFTINAGRKFERPVGVQSDWLSIDLQVMEVY